ncbi:hypothetical protein [Tindallia magadiensis]|nr:hypothetical protein [Tindallia magadiensis]
MRMEVTMDAKEIRGETMIATCLKKNKKFIVVFLTGLFLFSGILFLTDLSVAEGISAFGEATTNEELRLENREDILLKYRSWGEDNQSHYLERYDSVRNMNRRLLARILSNAPDNMEKLETTASHSRNEEKVMLYLKLAGSQRQEGQSQPVIHLCFTEVHSKELEKRSRQSIEEERNIIKTIDLHSVQSLRGPPSGSSEQKEKA